MRTAEIANFEQDERSGEMIALLKMIVYAKAIADDLKLPNTTFYLSNAVQDLSNEIQQSMHTDLPGIMVASLTTGKAGNC